MELAKGAQWVQGAGCKAAFAKLHFACLKTTVRLIGRRAHAITPPVLTGEVPEVPACSLNTLLDHTFIQEVPSLDLSLLVCIIGRTFATALPTPRPCCAGGPMPAVSSLCAPAEQPHGTFSKQYLFNPS